MWPIRNRGAVADIAQLLLAVLMIAFASWLSLR